MIFPAAGPYTLKLVNLGSFVELIKVYGGGRSQLNSNLGSVMVNGADSPVAVSPAIATRTV